MKSTNKPIDKLEEIDRIAKKHKEQADLDYLRKKSIEVEIYFDTYHVFPIIQGYWQLQTIPVQGRSVATFSDDKFLVQALAYMRYIPNIKLLRPHAVELGFQIEKKIFLPDEVVKVSVVNQFLENINLVNLEELQKHKLNGKLEEYISGISVKSEEIFKANYILAELNWVNRYNYLLNPKNPIVSFDKVKYENTEILQSTLFQEIVTALEGLRDRQYLSVNNLRDSLALCMFYEKVKKFEKDGKVIPLFYVSRSVLEILPDSIKKKFVVSAAGKNVNVLKDSEFFIIDSMFNEERISKDSTMFGKVKDLKDLFHFYSSKERFLAREIDELYDEWKEFRLNDFFEKVVVNGEASKTNLRSNIKELLSYIEENEDAVQEITQKTRIKIVDSFKEKMNDLYFLENIWKAVHSFDVVYHARVNKKNPNFILNDPDIFRDEGLTRFSPPTGPIEDQIKELWINFLNAFQTKNKQTIHTLKVKLTTLIYEGINKNGKKDYDKLLISACILWVFEKQRFIIQLLRYSKIDYGNHYQLGLIFLASKIKLEDISPKDMKDMDDIIHQIESRECYRKNYKAWIGMAFIKFNIWRLLAKDSKSTNKYSDYLEESIELSKKSFEYLEPRIHQNDRKKIYRNVKYYYSLNNFIYYSLEDKSEVNPFSGPFYNKYVLKLKEGQRKNEFRQSRSDDTLALYFLKKASNANTPSGRKKYIKEAEEWIERAIDSTILIDERYNNRLTDITDFKDFHNIES
jgi:hypothetical protein